MKFCITSKSEVGTKLITRSSRIPGLATQTRRPEGRRWKEVRSMVRWGEEVDHT